VDLEHLPDDIDGDPASRRPVPRLRSLAEVEREHILMVLRACQGQQAHAARVLGIARNTLWRKLEEYRRCGLLL
jgi:two-component system response regulator HydG